MVAGADKPAGPAEAPFAEPTKPVAATVAAAAVVPPAAPPVCRHRIIKSARSMWAAWSAGVAF